MLNETPNKKEVKLFSKSVSFLMTSSKLTGKQS